MVYEQLLGEFLSEYPEYNECIEYRDNEPVIDWSGLRVFLSWLRRHHYISDTVFSRGDELLHELETRYDPPGGLPLPLTLEKAQPSNLGSTTWRYASLMRYSA
jgi:hypothetical protein